MPKCAIVVEFVEQRRYIDDFETWQDVLDFVADDEGRCIVLKSGEQVYSSLTVESIEALELREEVQEVD